MKAHPDDGQANGQQLLCVLSALGGEISIRSRNFSEVLMPALRPSILALAIFFASSLPAPAALLAQEPPDPADTFHHDTRARMEKERRDGEWKKLKEDADKLVQAANNLKEMIEKSNKDTFSVSIVKKTEEVEKILKDIKRRAKNGF
jgi:hypothetical protein